MITDMISPIITTMTPGLTRHFTPMDPALTQFYTINNPPSFTGDFVLSVDVMGSNLSGDQAIIESSIFDMNLGEILFYIDDPDGLEIIIGTETGFIRKIFGGQSSILNGKLNKVTLKRENGVIKARLNGVQLGSSLTNTSEIKFSQGRVGGGNGREFDGIQANLKFIDDSGSEPVTTVFPLDQTGAFEDTRLTYNNFTASDPKLFNLTSEGNWLGQELVVNGGFDTDSDWIKQAGWSISGGGGISVNSIKYCYQPTMVKCSRGNIQG